MPETLRQIQAVDAIVQTIVSSPEDVVYISGSLMEGFGNTASDIDVFLITAEEPEYRGPFGSVLGEYYLDLEIYTRARVQELSERLDALDPAEYREVWLTPLADLDLYYRTLVGEACHNPQTFESLRSAFRRDVIEQLLAAWCGLRFAASLQHAREELAAYRPVNAALTAQAAAASALDSHLAAHGEAFPSLKWRFEKLVRLHGAASELYRRAWQLKAAESRDPAAYIEDVATFASELGMAPYQAWTLDDVPLQAVGELRSHDVAGEPYVLQNGRYAYSVDDVVRGVVDQLAGGPSTRKDVTRELHRDAVSVKEAIAALQARSLIRGY